MELGYEQNCHVLIESKPHPFSEGKYKIEEKLFANKMLAPSQTPNANF
jgi:hypothetical protein